MSEKISREFGRKPYMSKSYREMMKRETNFARWTTPIFPKTAKGIPPLAEAEWYTLVEKHSEFEKPYRFDAGEYPEMQHYVGPDNPYVPWEWDTPIIDDDPSGDGDTFWQFLGCGFVFPGLFPTIKRCEEKCEELDEHYMSHRATGPGVSPDDPIVLWQGFNGDVTMATPLKGCIRAWPDVKDGQMVRLVATTESGHHCHGFAWVKGTECCDLGWDSDGSISTIGREDSGVVKITGTQSPFQWSVTGTGFSLAQAETYGLTNTLITDATACGHAEITVSDAEPDCDPVIGTVNATEGSQWVYKSHECGMPGGLATLADEYSFNRIEITRIDGYKKQFMNFQQTGSGTQYLADAECVGPSPCADWFIAACSGQPTCLNWNWGPGVDEVQCSQFCTDCNDTGCGKTINLCQKNCDCYSGSWRWEYFIFRDPDNVNELSTYYEWECS